MITKMLQPSECSAYTLQEAEDIGIEKLLLKAPFGKVFILGEDKLLLGYYSAQHYEKSGNLDMQYNITCIQDDGGIRDQVINIPLHKKGKDYEILPIINSNGVFNGAIICTDNALAEDKNACLAKLEYLREKDLSIEYWFLSKKYKKVAFWGLDDLSLAFADVIRRYSNINLLGIYEDENLKEYKCFDFRNEIEFYQVKRFDIRNYDADINFVGSICDAAEAGADLIIVTDWTMRHLENSSLLKELRADVIYAPNILTDKNAHRIIDEDITRYVNAELHDRLKAKYRGMGCNFLTVGVPNESNLKIPYKFRECRRDGVIKYRYESFTEEYRTKWIAAQADMETAGEEFKDYYSSLLSLPEIKRNGTIFYGDIKSKYVNYTNKSRVVLNAPSSYKNTIYIIGPCIAVGAYNTDNHTLGHYLQENLNSLGLEYKVVMIGLPNGADRYYFVKILEEYDIKEGDKIFLIGQTYRQDEWDLDVLPVFEKLYEKYGYEFYLETPIHCGKEANKAIADFLTEHIDDPFDSGKNPDIHLPAATHVNSPALANNQQLKKYQEFLQSHAVKIGSIVMNCNPFTLGHLHLIEYAAEQVDHLYIFVVEEDRSFFKFDDRIELVKAGTSHLENVKVLPSGQFIISATTFAEYFGKESLDCAAIDPSLDVEIFGSQIAPCLNINVRFVGEEPLDPITAQYNQSMKEILPKYGVELCEIPRKETNGEVISASRVRKCLEEKNWDEIRKLVPKTTYSFLEEKFR